MFLPGAGTELYREVGAIILFRLPGTALATITVLPSVTVAALTLLQSRRSSSAH